MPWFMKRKKKKQKKVTVNTAKDDTVVTATSQPLFAVVVQDFAASVSDQICVERGQVVESLFAEEDWIYIRNVDGHCGYIPASFCFPLEKLRVGLPETTNNDKVQQFRAHPRPTTIHVDTFDGHVEEGGEARGDGEAEEVVNSPDSGISCSQQASSSNMDSVQSYQNTRERLVGGANSRGEIAQSHSHRQALDKEAGSKRGHTHNADRHKRFFMPINAPLLLLETAARDNDHSQQPSSREREDHSPSPPPLQPVNLADLRTKSTHQTCTEDRAHVVMEHTEGDERGSNNGDSSDGDDVFLPEAKKPMGIYQCAETYEPKFEGEMSLQRDEIVVVMEVGRGEWVWAVGSENKEGLVPKSLLHKYRPDLPEEEEEAEGEEGEREGEAEEEGEEGEREREEEEEGEIDVTAGEEGEEVVGRVRLREGRTAGEDAELGTVTSATQTELIVNGVVHEIACSPQLRHDTSPTVARDMATVSIQTEFTSPNWFKNNTPSSTPIHTLPRSTTVTTPHPPHPPHQQHNVQPPAHTHTSTASTSAPLKVLCNPRISQSSHASAAANGPPHPKLDRPARPTGPPSGLRLPLTPVSTTPSISLQTPSGTSGTRTLVEGTSGTTPSAVDNSDSTNSQSQAMRSRAAQAASVRGSQQVTSNGKEGTGQVLASQGTTAEGTGTMQRHRQALSQHTRIVASVPFEPDNEASSSRSLASTRRRMQPTPIVTSVRDYTPPRRAKNALSLHRGDIMYAQPHVPYPYGWVWVYHTLLKKYGYVPKDCIAYMYLVQKDQATIMEDVV